VEEYEANPYEYGLGSGRLIGGKREVKRKIRSFLCVERKYRPYDRVMRYDMPSPNL